MIIDCLPPLILMGPIAFLKTLKMLKSSRRLHFEVASSQSIVCLETKCVDFCKSKNYDRIFLTLTLVMALMFLQGTA